MFCCGVCSGLLRSCVWCCQAHVRGSISNEQFYDQRQRTVSLASSKAHRNMDEITERECFFKHSCTNTIWTTHFRRENVEFVYLYRRRQRSHLLRHTHTHTLHFKSPVRTSVFRLTFPLARGHFGAHDFAIVFSLDTRATFTPFAHYTTHEQNSRHSRLGRTHHITNPILAFTSWCSTYWRPRQIRTDDEPTRASHSSNSTNNCDTLYAYAMYIRPLNYSQCYGLWRVPFKTISNDKIYFVRCSKMRSNESNRPHTTVGSQQRNGE